MNSSSKVGFTFTPSSEQVGYYLSKYGPPSLLLGAGTAGLLHLMTKVKELNQEHKERTSADDTLTVPIPATPLAQKVAAISWQGLKDLVVRGAAHVGKFKGRYASGAGAGILGVGATAALGSKAPTEYVPESSLSDAGGIMATLLGGGLLGYGATNALLRNREREQLQKRLDSSKDQYGRLLGQTLAQPGDPKVASVDPDDTFSLISGMVGALVRRDFPDLDKNAESSLSLTAGAALTGLPVLAAVLAHKWMYRRQQELNALHADEKPKPPKRIQLVSAPAAASPAGPAPSPELPIQEADIVEPMALSAPKVAVMDEVRAANIQAANNVGAAGTALALGIPAIALLHGLFTGGFERGARQGGRSFAEGLGGGLAGTLGGAAIGSIGGLPGAAAGGVIGGILGHTAGQVHGGVAAERNWEEKKKKELASPSKPVPKTAGELPEFFGALALSKAVDGVAPEKKKKMTGTAKMPTQQDIAPGVSQITTSEGPVEVTAEDPRAAAIMRNGGTSKIRRLLSVFQASPEISASPESAAA